MISVAKHTIQFLRALFVTGLLLSVPLVANTQHAYAATIMVHMTDASDMQTNCAAYCAQINNVPPHELVLNHKDIRTPEPTPPEVGCYYLQFQKSYTPKVIRGSVYGASSIRPPDIVKLTGNYRF